MDKVLLYSYRIPAKGVKRKTIFHFSDSHLTAYDALSDEAETKRAIEGTASWAKGRKGFAEGNGEPWGELQQQDAYTHYTNLLSAANGGDAVVLAGDTMDYISGGNLRTMEKGLVTLKIPFVAVCGNHDKAEEIPEGMLLSMMKQPVSVVDLGDLLLVGVDDSERRITQEQLATLEQLFALGKKVILVMHVPIVTEENREKLMKCGSYFQLNYQNCPKENLKFISLISGKNSPVIAVLTGHLHFGNVSEIANGIYQYGSSQGIAGNMNQYIVGE